MFVPTVKLLLKFDDSSLYENISNTFLSVNGNTSVDILPNGLGYVMKQDQYLFALSFSTTISEKMILGFWLYPVNPGVVVNPDTNSIEGVEMPIINLVGAGNLTPVVSVFETTTEDDNNFLTVRLESNTYSVSTNNYSVGIWHHFWLVYDNSGSVEKLDIYIDGTLQDKINESGSVPISLTGNLVDIYINRHIDGFAYNKTNNFGYLDDMVIFDTDIDAEEKCQKMINYSVDYIVDDNYRFFAEKDYGVAYEDPTTLRINSLINDMSFIFVSRNDGKILRGSPLFWEVRKMFSDEREKGLLQETIIGDNEGESQINNGFLQITGSMVRM